MSRKYFGTDGIRGRVGDAPITADFVLRLGWAAGKVFGHSNTGVVTRADHHTFMQIAKGDLLANFDPHQRRAGEDGVLRPGIFADGNQVAVAHLALFQLV